MCQMLNTDKRNKYIYMEERERERKKRKENQHHEHTNTRTCGEHFFFGNNSAA